MATKETIWQKWTDESAETVHQMGYCQILQQVIALWDLYPMDFRYENRTSEDVAKQIWDEIEKEIEQGEKYDN
jgi:hypothetical protein